MQSGSICSDVAGSRNLAYGEVSVVLVKTPASDGFDVQCPDHEARICGDVRRSGQQPAYGEIIVLVNFGYFAV
jgi:hypothetical protein